MRRISSHRAPACGGPTKYQMIINLKVAKTLDLRVPAELLARADEVIELGLSQCTN
jgi:ABC-type uncharacterized transport system substrate-binding protein